MLLTFVIHSVEKDVRRKWSAFDLKFHDHCVVQRQNWFHLLIRAQSFHMRVVRTWTKKKQKQYVNRSGHRERKGSIHTYGKTFSLITAEQNNRASNQNHLFLWKNWFKIVFLKQQGRWNRDLILGKLIPTRVNFQVIVPTPCTPS